MFGIKKLISDVIKPKEDTPTAPLLFTLEDVTVMGSDYPSSLVKGKSRKQIISKTKVGTSIIIKPFTYERKPAYFVCNAKGQDMGTLSKGLAEYLSNAVSGLQCAGTITSIAGVVSITLNVYGKYKRAYEEYLREDTYRKEYKYNLTNPEDVVYYFPVNCELKAELKEIDNGFAVCYKGNPVGFITDERAERLASMLKRYKCSVSIYHIITSYCSHLDMILRF